MTLRTFLGKARRKALRLLLGENLYANIWQANQNERLIQEQIDRIKILENRINTSSLSIDTITAQLNEFERDKRDFIWVMSANEQELFKTYIKNSSIYLEFGLGGSTIAAIYNIGKCVRGVGKIYSVETNKEWIQIMTEKYEIIAKSIASGLLSIVYVDIGPVGDWGYPLESNTGNDNMNKFLNYSQNIYKEMPELKLADTVLIDGRFRVASCLYAMLETSEKTIFLFHDFYNRAQYQVLKQYVDHIDDADTLMVCKRKTNISLENIKYEFEKYKFNPE